MKIEIILGILLLFIITYTIIPNDSDIVQRILYILFLIGFPFLVYMFIKMNGLGLISTFFLIILLISLYGINYYVSLSCTNNVENKLVLYLYLALGLYFFFNQHKKIGNKFIDNTLGDCTYHKFSLAIIFMTMISSIFYADAPIFILCLFILYYLLT